MVALIVLVIILIFLVVFICLIPYFRVRYIELYYKKLWNVLEVEWIAHQEFSRRSKYWEDPANDPRWNEDHFQFSPKLGRHTQTSYERLNTSSINSSVSSGLAGSNRNIIGLPRYWTQMSVLRLCMMMSGTQIKSRWKFQQNLLRRVEKLYKPQRPGKLENWELTIFQIGIICCLCDVRMLVTLPRTLSASEKELSKYIINHPSTLCIRLIDCLV